MDISVSNHLDTDSWNQPSPRFGVEAVPEPHSTEKGYNFKIRKTTRSEIGDSALNIYNQYIRPGSEKELRIPTRMARTFQLAPQRNIEEQGRDDPEVFAEVKDYIYQTMESLHYPTGYGRQPWEICQSMVKDFD